MAKLLIGTSWYEELAPTALYEAEYEAILTQRGEQIYPGYYVVPFKKTIYSEDSAAKADLALVSKTYHEWWVVEVERADHALDSHVIPQVTTLVRGVYSSAEAEYLCMQHPTLDRTRVHAMLKGEQPGVMVVVNKLVPEWGKPLARAGVKVGVVEIFRSEMNEIVFRLNGFRPSAAQIHSSSCYFDPVLPSFLVIESPAVLAGIQGRMQISCGSTVSYWSKVETVDRLWLKPEGANPLGPKAKHRLIRRSDGTLEFFSF